MAEEKKEDSKRKEELEENSENHVENEKREKGVVETEICDEMQKAYIDYAMSVIVSRALPAAEDGLKPVHRRILYAMNRLGLDSSKQTVKCARIVGEVLGKYHPHSDIAVYDALVRMAQDFSLRYPLVHGQGNFGCFTADTKIALTDGRSLSFIDLVKENQQGKRNFTFTINKGMIKIAEIKNLRVTKKNTEIMKVVLDNGEEIKCTPNHKFMLRDGSYKEAKDLKSMDSLMPLYLKLSSEKDKIKPALMGYRMVYQPKTNTWIPCHNLADEWNLKKGIYKNNEGKIRHHIDFNKLNNNPNNIKRIKWEDHWKFHKEHTSKLHEDNDYKKKIAEGRKKYWNNLKNKEAYSLRLSERNKKNWENQAYREHMKKVLRDVNIKFIKEHPEAKEKASKNLKQLWRNEQYKGMMSKLKSKEMKERWQRKDPSLKKFNSESSKKLWSDPKHREHISNLSKKQWETNKEKIINAYKNKWKTDIEFRNYFLRILSENGRKANYYRFLNVCKKTFELFNDLNEENYEKVRKSYNSRNGAGIMKFRIALERFFNNDIEEVYKEIGAQTIKLNHKVVKIEFLREFADVYDLTIDKTHNFALASGVFVHNSIDNDPAAAMRYTEAKLNKIAEEMLLDLDKNTVEWQPNFDTTLKEPLLLPAKIPNLLVNGSSGIAVGMATNMPPHNLLNVCDAVIACINNPKIEIEKLIETIEGPDFPTGGYIVASEIPRLYKEGRANLIVRGRVTTEEQKFKEYIIITEIPYQVNKTTLIEKIAKLINEKKLPEVSDLRDESSKGKIRIVLELRKGADSKFTINRLYQFTDLQTRFDAIMLALVAGQPRILNLKEMIEVYISHRKNVVKRRVKFDVDRAEERKHIVEGLLIALKNLQDIIELIKKSRNPSEASQALTVKFNLSGKQAQAVLDMRLAALTNLEREKLNEENKSLEEKIKEFRKILADEKEIFEIIKSDLRELKRDYGDTRKTTVLQRVAEIEEKDLIAKKQIVVTITGKGYVKRMAEKVYKEQKRGGRGVIGSDLSTGDFVKQIITCSTHDYMMFFTNKGKVYWLKAYEIPEVERYGKGKAIVNLLNVRDETVTSVIPVSKFDDFLLMVTRKGIVKKLLLQALSKPRKTGLRAITLPSEDSLVEVQRIREKQEILIVTADGQAIRFSAEEVRAMGRASYGVTGIKLEEKDYVVSLEVLPETEAEKKETTIFAITEKGYGKRSELEEYRKTGRACKGVINLKVTGKTGRVITTVSAKENDSAIVSTAKGMVIRVPVKEIRVMGRSTQGVRVIRLREDDAVTDFVRLNWLEESEEKPEQK